METNSKTLSVIDAHELMERYLPPPKFCGDTLLPHGLSICARAETAQMTPSAFVRAAAMRHKVTVVPGLKEATHELKAIGRNLNQLAILAHEGKVQFARLDEVYEKLSLVYLALCELAEQESR